MPSSAEAAASCSGPTCQSYWVLKGWEQSGQRLPRWNSNNNNDPNWHDGFMKIISVHLLDGIKFSRGIPEQ